MNSKTQNSNIQFLNDMKKVISKKNENYFQVKENLLNLQYAQNEKEFLNEINVFKEVLERNDNSSEKTYIKDRQNCFDELRIKFKKYYEKILNIYENNYIKKIKEYNQNLEDLINSIIPEFEPKNQNSLISINIFTSNESYREDERGSLSKLDNYNSYFKFCNNQNNNKILINDDISNSTEIKYNCSVCFKEKVIFFCDECYQLFCNDCFKEEEKFGNKDKKCLHNFQNIVKMKERNEIGKKLFLNSLNIFIKRIILKSNYLLNYQSQKLTLVKDSDINSSKINFIKKKLFEYPIINEINDSIEINYLKSINDILVNNLEINNIDMKSFNLSDIEEGLVNSLKNIFMKKKIHSNFDLSKSIEEKNEYIDEDTYTEEEIKDESRDNFDSDEDEESGRFDSEDNESRD